MYFDHPAAGRYAVARHLLYLAEHTPGIPFPRIAPGSAALSFTGYDDPAQARKDAETVIAYALGITFEDRPVQEAGSTKHHIRSARTNGLRIDLVALAEHIGSPASRQDELETADAA